MKPLHTLIAAAAMLTGCETIPEPASEPAPTCSGAADCKAKWEAAQLFVVKNADLKIQTVTDVLIETYNAVRSTDIMMRITKEPVGAGVYQLVAVIDCSNPFGCSARPSDLRRQFTATIQAASP